MSKRPPLGTTGKLALAGKRNRARQLLDREQREHDRRDLLLRVRSQLRISQTETSEQAANKQPTSSQQVPNDFCAF